MKPHARRREALIIVLRNVGMLLRYISAVPLGLIPVAAHYQEGDALWWSVAMAATFFAAGALLAQLPARREPRLREGLLIAAVGWLMVPLGSVVLFMGAEGWGFLDAYFESMSAWTGTGMTVADVTTLEQTTLFWRTLMQWVGGLGVIVLTLAVLARPGTGAYTLYVSEAREEKLRPSVLSTVRTLWRIYMALSVGAILVMLAAGLPFWHALNTALTAIGTGGMSLTAGSIGEYGSLPVELGVMVVTVTGALPFVALYALLHRRWGGFFRDEQVRAFFVILALAIPLMMFALLRGPYLAGGASALREGAFQVVSAVTTSGFQTTDFKLWPPVLKIGLAGLMLLGGAAGSTAGGLKLVRGILLVKGALWKLRRSGLPSFAVTAFPFGGERLHEQEANEEFAEASFVLVLWVATLFLGGLTLLALLPHVPLQDVFFELVSAQSNIGLSTGVVSAALPAAAKAAFLTLMWAGRLEILPALLLLRAVLPLRTKH